MKILVLDDDLRRHAVFADNLAQHTVVHCQTYDSCIRALEQMGPFDVAYLDHDLNDHATLSYGPSKDGGVRKMDGRDVVNFIRKKLPKSRWPTAFVVHSANPTRGDQMVAMLQAAEASVSREEFHPYIGR